MTITQVQKKHADGVLPVWDNDLAAGDTLIAVFRQNFTGLTTPWQPTSGSGYLPLVQAFGADNYIGFFGKTAVPGEPKAIPTNTPAGTYGAVLMEYASDQGPLTAGYTDSEVMVAAASTLSLGPAPSRAAKGNERLLLVASSTNGGQTQVNVPPWTNGFVEQYLFAPFNAPNGSIAELMASWGGAADTERSTNYSISQVTYRQAGAMLELFVQPDASGGGGAEVSEPSGLKFDAVSGTWKDVNALVSHITEDVREWR